MVLERQGVKLQHGVARIIDSYTAGRIDSWPSFPYDTATIRLPRCVPPDATPSAFPAREAAGGWVPQKQQRLLCKEPR
jgi:hypothetical protein